MTPANLGAVRRLLLGAAVLALSSAPVSAQVVEKGRTFSDLTATYACAEAYTNRIARVTDCDAADDVGDGGGAFQCWVQCDGTAPWETVAIGGGGGLPGADEVTESMLKATNAATDEYVLTYESTVGDFEWQAAATGTIGGTLTATDNLICRTDGVGGSTIQASPLSLSDVSGVTTTLATITPAATTGATVAGQALAFTASPAVASTDTAGAAAGGAITLTAGAAARFTSGNANGGDINLATGAGIGTGTAGQVVFPVGAVGAPSIAFSGDPNTGFYWGSGDTLAVSTGGSIRFSFGNPMNLYASIYGNGNELSSVRRYVPAITNGVGSPFASTTANSFMPISNEGAAAKAYTTLPTAASGLQFEFVVQDADGLRATANTGDTIRVIDKVTAAAGYIESTTIGSTVTLMAVNATEWLATSINGVWTDGTWSYDDTSLTTP